MNKGKVYVVQQPAYFNRTTREWVQKYDLSSAKEHGELVYLLGPGNIFKDRMANATDTIKYKMREFGPDDHILAIGDPVAIALTTMIAGNINGGSISLLKYDRITARYESYRLEI